MYDRLECDFLLVGTKNDVMILLSTFVLFGFLEVMHTPGIGDTPILSFVIYCITLLLVAQSKTTTFSSFTLLPHGYRFVSQKSLCNSIAA